MISQKKNILLLHSSNDLYGASKIFLQLIDLFLSKDFNIHIVLPEKGKLDDFLNQKDIKVSYNELGVLRKKYLNPLGLVNRFVSNIKSADIDPPLCKQDALLVGKFHQSWH